MIVWSIAPPCRSVTLIFSDTYAVVRSSRGWSSRTSYRPCRASTGAVRQVPPSSYETLTLTAPTRGAGRPSGYRTESPMVCDRFAAVRLRRSVSTL
jgi:hypothetical protein